MNNCLYLLPCLVFLTPSLKAQEPDPSASTPVKALSGPLPPPSTSSPSSTTSDADAEALPVAKAKVPLKISVGLGLTAADAGIWENVSISDGTTDLTGDAQVEFGSAPTVLFDCKMNYVPHRWGFGFGAYYEFARKAEHLSVTIAGTKSESDTEDPAKIAQGVAYGNAVYRWQSLSINFGLNYNIVELTTPPGDYGAVKVRGGAGLQFGMSGDLGHSFALDLMYRQTALSMKQSMNGLTLNYGDGYISLIYFGARYYVN